MNNLHLSRETLNDLLEINAYVEEEFCLRYFGANTMWYLQFHVVCAKLFLSFMTTSFSTWCGWGTTLIVAQEVFYLKLKLLIPPA